jgi:hypothetical protein
MCDLPENDIVTRINMTLESFLKDMTFCQHDSEYRLDVNEETPKILEQLNSWLNILKHSHNEYYLYGCDPYKLTQHFYQYEQRYAFKNFQIISKSHFDNYCKTKGLNPDNYFYKDVGSDFGKKDVSLKLSDVVQRLTTKNNYCIPHTIYLLSKNHVGTSSQFRFGKFKFIDVLALA